MRRLRAAAPAFVFAAVVLALFWDILLSRDYILSASGEDLTSYYVGMRRFGFDELRRGNLALWNPLIYSGAPYFGNFESALLYPPNWAYLVLPLANAINAGIALHVFMAGYFTFLWRRFRGTSELGSLLSGLIFMLSGPYFLHIFPGHLSNLCVMAWMPMLFLALDGWFDTGEAKWCLLGAFTVAMQILAGHPQYVYYTAMAAALYSLLRLYGHPRWLKLGAGAAAAYAGGALITAVQLLTGLQAVSELTRGVGSQHLFSRTFGLAPENLLTLLVPNIFGDMLRQPYYGRWHLWEGSLFVGVGGLVLACLGATAPRKTGRRAELWTALACLFLAMGSYTPLYDVLDVYLPGYNLFRGTSKFISLTGLFLAALAGTGFDRLRGKPRWPVFATVATGAAGVLMTGLWLWLSVPKDWGQTAAWKTVFEALGSTKQGFYPPALYHSVANVRAAAAFAAGEFLDCGRMLLLVSLVLYLLGYSKRWLYALALLTALDVFAFARHSRVVTPLEAEYPSAWKEAAAKTPGDYRVLHIGIPARNPVMSAGVQDVWGYSPLLMTRYFKLTDYFWRLTTWGSTLDPKIMLIRNPILALFRCRYIFLNDGDKTILNVPESPRLRLVEDWVVMKDPDKIFPKLMDPAFDSRKTVVLESPPDPLPEKGGAAGKVAVIRSSTDMIEIEADLPRAAILLVGDAYSEHWRVRSPLDGAQKRYDVMPADYALRAVPLAAGHHRLIMEYRPSGFVIGRWISLFSLLVFAGLCVLVFTGARWELPSKRRRTLAALAFLLGALIVEAAGFGAGVFFGAWKTRGVRDRDLGWIFPYPQKPDGKAPEMLFLGDSVTSGGELPDERWKETFPVALGGFNAGMDGYSTYQERDLFVRDLAALRPKKVALVICFNDIMTEAESKDMIRVTLQENFDVGERTLLDYEPYFRLYRWLRARAAYKAWTEKDPDAKTTPIERASRLELDGSKPVDPKVWAEWTNALLDLRKAAAPAPFSVILAPLRPHVRAYREGRRDFWVNRELAKFCREHGIPFLDLLPAFARAEASENQSFGDPFHFTVVGHRIAAAAIAPFMKTHAR